MNQLAEISPLTRGRVLAVFYVTVIVGGIVAQVLIADRMVGGADASTAVANIVANKTLYRLAFTIFMVEMASQMVATMMFHDLLKPVNHSVSRLMLIFGLMGSGFKTFGRLFFYAPLILLSGAAYLSAIPKEQLDALAFAFIKINNQAAGIGLFFFGLEGTLRGWLIFKSTFLPKFLGVLGMAAGLGWVTWIYPPLGSRTFMVVALFAIVGVFLTAGWLMFRGVDDVKWRELSHARSL